MSQGYGKLNKWLPIYSSRSSAPRAETDDYVPIMMQVRPIHAEKRGPIPPGSQVTLSGAHSLRLLRQYPVPSFRMSRSFFTRASSAHKRPISICSGLTDFVAALQQPTRLDHGQVMQRLRGQSRHLRPRPARFGPRVPIAPTQS